VHGTYRRNLDSILQSGLKRMARLHVHFSCGLPSDGEVISGMLCHWKPTIEYVLMEASAKAKVAIIVNDLHHMQC
jgi:RNA:NAD 2'-phosphotransferase (TPT1/KptA family)